MNIGEFELDVALPEFLGFSTILLRTKNTIDYEKEYQLTTERGYFAKDYDEVLSIIETEKLLSNM